MQDLLNGFRTREDFADQGLHIILSHGAVTIDQGSES